MRVFVAGATGVIGRELLPQLNAAGHAVVGMARSPEGLLAVDKLGGKAVRGDVLDSETVRRLVLEASPEVIVNLAARIPRKLRLNPKDWEENNRVRLEGGANLRAAAKEAGIRLFVQESVGYVCQSRGDQWIEEETPRSTHAFLQPVVQLEDQTRASGLPFALLRFAALSSASSWHTQQTVAALRRGLLPIVGDGDAYVSQIHLFDAAQSIVCALSNPQAAAGQTFHVADDSPVRMREMLTFAAQCLHAPAPKRVPPFMAKMVVGALTLEILAASYRIANLKIKRELGFTPRYPTYHETWTQIAQEIGDRDFTPSDDLK